MYKAEPPCLRQPTGLSRLPEITQAQLRGHRSELLSTEYYLCIGYAYPQHSSLALCDLEDVSVKLNARKLTRRNAVNILNVIGYKKKQKLYDSYFSQLGRSGEVRRTLVARSYRVRGSQPTSRDYVGPPFLTSLLSPRFQRALVPGPTPLPSPSLIS